MGWTEEDKEKLNKFINDLLYEDTTIDDYLLVFDSLGIEYKASSDDTYRLRTACHNANPHDGDFNLAFDTETRQMYCHSKCHKAYNLLTLVKSNRILNGLGAGTVTCLQYICNVLGKPCNYQCEVVDTTNRYQWNYLKKYMTNSKDTTLKIYDDDILDQLDHCVYLPWVEEGISPETQMKYEIGWYGRKNSVTIPCRDVEGNLIGIRQRFLDPADVEARGKYNPLRLLNDEEYKFPTNNCLYGINYNNTNISRKRMVVLFEGEKSVMIADSMFKDNCALAMYGKSMSQKKVTDILNLEVNEVVIAIDFDYETTDDDKFEEFKDDVLRIGNYFKGHCKVSVLIDYDKHPSKSSPIDLGYDKYMELFANREVVFE